MTEDPLERFEDVIVNELCAYQAWLDSTDPSGTARRSELEDADRLLAGTLDPEESDSVVPAQLRRSLDEFRHCRDVLYQVRIQADSDASKSAHTVVATPIDNVVGSTRGNSPVAPDWSVQELTDSGLPSRIGRFQIRRRLGIGGFGIVFLGFDPVARRERAIKIPRPEFLGSLHLMERFQREVAAVAPLDHPNIVPVLESSFYGVTPYIVMPYVSDITLAGWRASQSGISPRDAAEIVRQLADGMAHAHERGVLHRDVKPGNVLLAPRTSNGANAGKVAHGSAATNGTDGGVLPFVPRLTDFGMAKQAATEISEELQQTRTGTVIGTICYMSPEQAEGRNKDITARSDVYGLGATLFELLTGAPPYRGLNDLQTLQNISRNEPLTLQSPGMKPISQDLQVICLKALEKDPRKRFDSAAELSGELDRYLRGLPIYSRPIAPIERCWRWARRRPGMAGMLGLGIFALMTIVALIAENRVAHQRNQAKYTLKLEKLNQELEITAARRKEQQSIAEANERRAKDGLYAYEINRAAVAWKQEDTREMFELLDRHIPGPGEVDRRGFEWWYLRRQASLAKRVLLEIGSPVYVLQFSPDRRVLASGGKDSIVRLFDPETGVVHQEIATGQIEVNGIAFSPDGQELATSGDDGTIRIWNLATGNERLKIKTPFRKAFELAYSPDGTRIVSTGSSQVICLYNPQTGALLETLQGHTREVEHIAFVDNDNTLVSTSHDNSVRIWKLDDRTGGDFISDLGDDHLGDVEPFIFLQDRRLLIIGDREGQLRSINIDQKREISRVKQLDGINKLSLHPGGSLLAVGDSKGRVRLRRLEKNGELAGEEYKPWQAHQKKIAALVWSTDGSRLISAGNDGQILTWSVKSALRDEPQLLQLDPLRDVGHIPKMPLLVTNGPPQGTLIRWGLVSGHPPVSTVGNTYSRWALSGDGKYLAVSQRDSGMLTLFTVPDDPLRRVDEVSVARWDTGGYTDSICFSPDSKTLLVTYDPRGTNEGNSTGATSAASLSVPHFGQINTIPFPIVRDPKYSPSGDQIVFHTIDELILWNVSEQKVVWRVPSETVLQKIFSPDGTLIATALKQRQMVIRRAVDGSTKYRFAIDAGGDHRRLLTLAFSPDSRTLVFANNDRRLRFCHMATGQQFFELPLPEDLQRIVFSEDGRQLFCQVFYQIIETQGVIDVPHGVVVFDASDPTEDSD